VIALLEENAHREVLTDFYEPAQICEPFIMACLPYPWSSVQHYHPALVVPKVPSLCLYPFNHHTDGSKYMVLGKPSLTAARFEETCFRRRFTTGLTKHAESRPPLSRYRHGRPYSILMSSGPYCSVGNCVPFERTLLGLQSLSISSSIQHIQKRKRHIDQCTAVLAVESHAVDI
jgi:hypothetical protein